MGLFSKRKASDTEEKQLILTITQATLSANLCMNSAWKGTTGHKLTHEADFMIRREMLYFFLTMTDRYAFAIGGTKFRDTLMGKIAKPTIEGIIDFSFKLKSIFESKAEQEAYLTGFTDSLMEEYNQVEIDYGNRKLSEGSPTIGDTPYELLSRRINEIPFALGLETARQFRPKLVFHVAGILGPTIKKGTIIKQIKKIHSLSSE